MPIPAPAHANALANIIIATRAYHHGDHHGKPDWNHTAVCNTIRKNLDHPAPYGDIVIALVKYARDSNKRVPSFLFDALADWAPPGQTAPKNPCEDHAGQDARTCVCCASDILTGLRTPEYRGRHYNIPDTLETAMTRKDTQ